MQSATVREPRREKSFPQSWTSERRTLLSGLGPLTDGGFIAPFLQAAFIRFAVVFRCRSGGFDCNNHHADETGSYSSPSWLELFTKSLLLLRWLLTVEAFAIMYLCGYINICIIVWHSSVEDNNTDAVFIVCCWSMTGPWRVSWKSHSSSSSSFLRPLLLHNKHKEF